MKFRSTKEDTMHNRSRDPRSPAQKEGERRAYAEASGKSVDEIRAIEDALRKVPREHLIEQLYGRDHGAFYDAGEDLWIVPDPKHDGPGFGFIAIRSDRSWFGGVVPPEAFQ
jgi:hypothetical protein